MSKRDSGKFDRIPKDLYRTWDTRAVEALAPHLYPGTRYIEPCAGAGDLIDQLNALGHVCINAMDIDPLRDDILTGDATTTDFGLGPGTIAITNPPWKRSILHKIIANIAPQMPVWLLFDSDWVFTAQSAPFLPALRKIVAVGRMKWIPDTTMDGYDNVSWHCFDGTRAPTTPEFHGRRNTDAGKTLL